MQNKYIPFLLIAVLLIGAGAVVTRAASHRGGDHMFGHHMGWIARQLDLTDAQKTQVKSMIRAERSVITPLLQQLVTERQQMLAATTNGAFDKPTVQGMANQQAQTIAQLMVEREKLISQVYQQVLTPEQKAKADALRKQMSERMTQRLQKFATQDGSRGEATQPK